MAQSPSRFQPYTNIASSVPARYWRIGRYVALLATLGLVVLILRDPPRGLKLFWQLLFPCLPLVFATAPGLWRQLCPMAFLNQLPVVAGKSLGRSVPPALLNHAYLIAIGLFVALVVLKRPLLFESGAASSVMIVLSLALAALGGFVFKGRSGWCGTFCPLAPLQKLYGHAPPVLVRNGYCPTCVGCQKNCYDFNPMAAIHADLDELPKPQSEHRTLFAALLPGLVLAAWLADPYGERGTTRYLAEFSAFLLGSAGAFLLARSILPLSPYRLTAGFGMAALVLFYWFEAAPMVGALSSFTGIVLPHPAAAYLIIGAAVVVAARVLVIGLANERAYVNEREAQHEPRIGVELSALERGQRLTTQAVVRERSSGRSFAIDADRTLLEVLEKGGFAIPFGCRSGVCGADPVAVLDGQQNLSPPTPEEFATLKRLGLLGRARLACVCRVRGPVEVDLLADVSPRAIAPATHPSDVHDLAAAAGIQRVVIIGNGVAGTTAAELIRANSASCQIDIVARENHHFYNRMALGRVMHSRTGLDGLHLMPPGWFEQHKINVWLNTLAVRIDPERHEVRLGTGDVLSYDRLILAQGAKAVIPAIPGRTLPGVFVLRKADDALLIRSWSQAMGGMEAAVVGGGVLGVEAASALKALGLRATILHRGIRLMDRHLDEKGAAILARFLTGAGIEVRLGVQVSGIAGDDHVSAIRLAGGDEIAAQLCLFCAGIRPDTALARAAGLHTNRGVLVDGWMRTSMPDILAFGDVAEVAGEPAGLWTFGARHAEIAVSGMLAKAVELPALHPSIHLKVPGIDVHAFGEVNATGPDIQVLTDPDDGDSEHRKIVLRAGRLAGAVFVGPPGTGKAFAALAAKGFDISPIEERITRGEWQAVADYASAGRTA